MDEKNNRNQCEADTYSVRSQISPTLSKISKSVRQDKKVSKGLDKLTVQLESKAFHSGRGAQKLAGTKTVFYMRAGGQARLFFRYSAEEKGVIEILAESNKDEETKVIANLKGNYE